jgi:hypothetical protein
VTLVTLVTPPSAARHSSNWGRDGDLNQPPHMGVWQHATVRVQQQVVVALGCLHAM